MTLRGRGEGTIPDSTGEPSCLRLESEGLGPPRVRDCIRYPSAERAIGGDGCALPSPLTDTPGERESDKDRSIG